MLKKIIIYIKIQKVENFENKYECFKIEKFPILSNPYNENHLIISRAIFASQISYTKDETILKNVQPSEVHFGALMFPTPIEKVLL